MTRQGSKSKQSQSMHYRINRYDGDENLNNANTGEAYVETDSELKFSDSSSDSENLSLDVSEIESSSSQSDSSHSPMTRQRDISRKRLKKMLIRAVRRQILLNDHEKQCKKQLLLMSQIHAEMKKRGFLVQKTPPALRGNSLLINNLE